MRRVHELRLVSSLLWVDVRLFQADGRWMASADAADGPTVGLGRQPEEALRQALQPFEGMIDELMDTVPEQFHWARRAIG